MNTLKVLSAAAALALVLPMTSPSFAQGLSPGGARGGGGGGGGGGASIGGGGASIGGGGGGGARMGGGGPAFQGGGGGMGGGAGMRPSTGNFAAGPAARPGGGSFVGGLASRPGVAPSYSGSRHVATGGNWHGGGGRHWHRHHRRGGFWPGFAAGAAIGGIGSYAYYGRGYGYYDDPYYYGYYDEPSVAVVQDGGGDSVAYCSRRFKSYDPASGTYLGYDGKRHPCP